MRYGILLVAAAVALSATPLTEAVKAGNKEAIKSLLAKKADVNAADGDGSTALHWAAYRDDIDTADQLIKAGAKANATTDLGATPLWLAAQNGSVPMVKRLLDAGGNPNLALMEGETPVMSAARGGFAPVLELLLSKGANPDAKGPRGQTALMWAASQSHPEAVKVLIAHKANLHLKSDSWTDVMAIPPHGYLPYNKAIPHGAETALMFAARVGDLASAKLLVAAGANVNDADAWGVSALTLSEFSGFTELSLYLIDKGADPNAAPNGFNALHEAIMRRDEKVVAALLEHKADPNAAVMTWTPTRRSSSDFHFEPYLIGAPPYWLAARYSEPNVMKMLLEHGADPKFVHKAVWTTEQGFGAVEKKETANAVGAAVGMVPTGAAARDDGAPSRDGAWAPLPRGTREAAILGSVKIAVENGADVNLPNVDGRTALDVAKGLNLPSVVTYLTEHGAKAGTAPAPAGRGRGRGN